MMAWRQRVHDNAVVDPASQKFQGAIQDQLSSPASRSSFCWRLRSAASFRGGDRRAADHQRVGDLVGLPVAQRVRAGPRAVPGRLLLRPARRLIGVRVRAVRRRVVRADVPSPAADSSWAGLLTPRLCRPFRTHHALHPIYYHDPIWSGGSCYTRRGVRCRALLTLANIGAVHDFKPAAVLEGLEAARVDRRPTRYPTALSRPSAESRARVLSRRSRPRAEADQRVVGGVPRAVLEALRLDATQFLKIARCPRAGRPPGRSERPILEPGRTPD